MNKEQVQLVTAALHFELGEPERAQGIENLTHVFVDSPAAGRLLSAVRRGEWASAAAMAAGVVSRELADEAIFEIEACHVTEVLLSDGGGAAMHVIKTCARPEHASQLGLMLFNPPRAATGLRQRLHDRLRQMLGPQHTVPSGRLAALLRAALQFRTLEQAGTLVAPPARVPVAAGSETGSSEEPGGEIPGVETCVRAYVLEAIAALSLEPPLGTLAHLQSLCDVSAGLNLFGIRAINDMVREVMKRALDEDPVAAIQIMRQRKSTSNDIIERIFGNIVSQADDSTETLGYNYLERYEQHRTPDMPQCDSVLQLGQVIETVLNKFTPRVPLQSLFMPVEDQQGQFPSTIIQKLRLDSEVWVVAFSHDGSYLATACANGKVLLDRVDLDPFKLTREGVVHLSSGAHRIAWHPNRSKLLAEDTEGFAILWDADKGTQTAIKPRQPTENPGACGTGDFYWHPTDPDLFFRVEWDHTLSLHHVNGEDTKWWYSLNEPLQSVTPAADKRLAVLTAKCASGPQRILVFDDYDAPNTVEEYALPLDEGQYSSLQCSSWDPRTLMLMGPNRAALLLDISGEREVITLNGPLQHECIIRPQFAGPMDKYVLSGSEEKDPPAAWVFNRFTGEVVTRYEDHKDVVNSVALFPGEKMTLLATGGDDMDVIIYAAHADDASASSDDDKDRLLDGDSDLDNDDSDEQLVMTDHQV